MFNCTVAIGTRTLHLAWFPNGIDAREPRKMRSAPWRLTGASFNHPPAATAMFSSCSRYPFWHRLLPFPLALAALVCFTGCLTFETLITVRDDGSGTIEMVFALSGPMLDMITSLAGNESLCDEENLQEEASKMGEGVRLSSAEPIDEDGRKGCRAFYDFDDINQLTINQNPGDQMPSGMTPDEPTSTEDVVTFSFTPGSPATLVINLPQDFQDNNPDEDPTAVDSTQVEEQLAMMSEMLEGARIHMALAVEGAITETNASYRNGNRITLIEIDFDRLLEDDEQLERLSDANPQTTAEVKALLEGIDGIKIETGEEILVRFE